MCYAAVLPIAAAVIGAGTSVYGAAQSAGAAKQAAQATETANLRTQQAQNQAFNQRMEAARRQTEAQSAVMNQTMTDRYAAAQQMREAQGSAMDLNKQNLLQENQTAEALRAEGDKRAQELLGQTNAEQLARSQAERAQQQNLLLDQNMPTTGPGPGETDPGAGMDSETRKALARRGAEAAVNVREYGAKTAKLASYGQPIMDVGQAITGSKFGIMPAQAASELLRAGAPVRALPGQIAFRNAGSEGTSLDELIRSRGQSGLDTAGLSYGNDISLANLRQGNENVLAANTLGQAKADAAYKQQLAGIWSQLGNLGLYGAGYFGGNPFGGGASVGSAQGAINSGAVAPPGSFSYRGL